MNRKQAKALRQSKGKPQPWIDGTAEGRIYGLTMQDKEGKQYEIAATISCPECKGRTYMIKGKGNRKCAKCGQEWTPVS